jgi:hypothetical protein
MWDGMRVGLGMKKLGLGESHRHSGFFFFFFSLVPLFSLPKGGRILLYRLDVFFSSSVDSGNTTSGGEKRERESIRRGVDILVFLFCLFGCFSGAVGLVVFLL